ncbi:MAG TPA: hypothetical protein VFE46_05360, partial [Pirellulales bacterium]|nr:hypothetical protein [Pirellulales bacterium]
MAWIESAKLIVFVVCLAAAGEMRAHDAHGDQTDNQQLTTQTQADSLKNISTVFVTDSSESSPATENTVPSSSDTQRSTTSCNSTPLWCRDSIGLRIDFNPFANADCPSRRFNLDYGISYPLLSTVNSVNSISLMQRPGLVAPTVQLAHFLGSNSEGKSLESEKLQQCIGESQNGSDDDVEDSVQTEAIVLPAPTAEEQLWLHFPSTLDGSIVIDHGVFKAAMQQPLAPLQPLQPVQPPSITPYEPSLPGAFETLGTTSIAELAATVGGGPAQGVSQSQAQAIASTDIGGLLQSANSVQSVNTTRRSPVALAPNVRGYEFGQIYAQATGAYWFPVREDLDSMLSKIDPGMIQEVVVIPGPYGVRYGAGLSFIDIITQDTPRYDDGPQSSYRAN